MASDQEAEETARSAGMANPPLARDVNATLEAAPVARPVRGFEMATQAGVRTAGTHGAKTTAGPGRKQLIDALNEDLAREYQAIIAYVVYSQVIRGAEFMAIARELEVHAGEELQHALTVAKQIDYLGGEPTVKALPVKTSDDPRTMLRADLDNEVATIRGYRERITQCEALKEFAVAEEIREILRQEQEHAIDLATALGEDVPKI
jgi:bacterioferritin